MARKKNKSRTRKRKALMGVIQNKPAQAIDESPTEQVVKKRALLARGGDPAMTTNPLDLMETRGVITREQAQAGHRFAWLRYKTNGSTYVSAQDFSRVSGGSSDFEHENEADWLASYREAETLLKTRGSASIYWVVWNVAVKGVFPAYFTTDNPKRKWVNELKKCKAGLEILEEWCTR